MGSQRVGHDWAIELIWLKKIQKITVACVFLTHSLPLCRLERRDLCWTAVLLLGVTLDSGVDGWAYLMALTLLWLKQKLAGMTFKIQRMDKRRCFKITHSLGRAHISPHWHWLWPHIIYVEANRVRTLKSVCLPPPPSVPIQRRAFGSGPRVATYHLEVDTHSPCHISYLWSCFLPGDNISPSGVVSSRYSFPFSNNFILFCT